MAEWHDEDHPRDRRNGEFVHATTGSWARDTAGRIGAQRQAARDAKPPAAALKGFLRVGDHPQGYGKLGAADPDRDPLPQSAHPDAGGVWVDPREMSVGRRRYFNDSGWMPVSGYAPKARSRRHKEQLQAGRMEDFTCTPADRERRPASEGGKIGYGLGESEHAAPFRALMKRAQPRARQEAAREAVRRTPRGVRVENWMERADARMTRRGGR